MVVAMANPIDIQNSMSGVDFPIGKAELLNYARNKNAPKDVMAALNGLPDREFKSPAEVLEAVGGALGR